MTQQLNMVSAITQALDQEMEKNEKVLVFGEDVGVNGGVFRATEGLHEKYGDERVSDTPLAESAIGGMAFGLSVQGFRPVAEIQFFGFVFEVMDSVVGQISRQRFRMGGHLDMPVVIRSPFGGGVRTPEMHADSLEGLMAQAPGLKVVIPSNPYDAKGLLTAAIRDNDPVVFLEHMKLYRSFREEVPEEQYEIELGKANVAREGSDVTVVAYGYMVREALKAAEELEKEDLSVEVIDLRTVSPIDYETIVASVEKTGRMVFVQEAQRQAGVGNTVISEISQRSILSLKAPISFVSAPDTVFPFAQMENLWLPSAADITEAIKETADF
ncbi:pyruvate dehydrogenase E1 component beta subunit [Atopostipes suicloacalis DSM 15692]|uniref:Pyruvate dehydrogenase E1 component beta subunit n=1 Tax=Atopostipes suicloacalis DSM 15692 TaxID=1121025 RepID=A0A1M4VY58_9LACT|nr:alpha-ketoacid dehydrogenase subunit beta [Atopostipes suicloacalis]SHE73908.1 pyruvate dehydrogenase E1 component beta subunit [Atopostipes suicloacalis DSM 15692]